MNNIFKIERALVFAKEVNLNDEQVKELIAMVLGLFNFKLNIQPQQPPVVPWVTPGWPNDGTTIIYGIPPQNTCTLEEFTRGLGQSNTTVQETLPVHPIISQDVSFKRDGINRLGCACSPIGTPHSDNCKAG